MSDDDTEVSDSESSESETSEAPLFVDNPDVEKALWSKALQANHKPGEPITLDPVQSKLLLELLNANRRQHRLWECNHQGCHQVYITRKARDQHRRDAHSGRTYVCSQVGCAKTFTAKRYLEDHEKRHGASFQCDQCNRSYTTKGSLKRHKETVHQQGARVDCPNEGCSQSFAAIRKDNYNRHVEICKKKSVAERRGLKRIRDPARPGYLF